MKRLSERIVTCERWNAESIQVSRVEQCRLPSKRFLHGMSLKACREPAALVLSCVS